MSNHEEIPPAPPADRLRLTLTRGEGGSLVPNTAELYDFMMSHPGCDFEDVVVIEDGRERLYRVATPKDSDLIQ